MKKRYITLLCSTLLVSALYAKNKPITFEKTYGSKNNDSAHVVMPTDDGYVIVGTTEYERKRSDMYLLKIDKSGKKIWSKAIGGDDEKATSIIKAKDGYILSGKTTSNRDKREEVYVVKLDKNENL